jgi:hypothetical protein
LRAQALISTVRDIRAAGITGLTAIAAELRRRKVPAARGGKWHPATVARLLSRLESDTVRIRVDRATLQQHLEEAESRVERGLRNIAHQREIISILKRGGHDATAAKGFLRRLESAQQRDIVDRDQLIKELAASRID